MTVALSFDPTSAEDVRAVEKLIPLLTPAPPAMFQPDANDEQRFWTNLRPRLGDDSLHLLCVKAAKLGSFASLGELADYMAVAEPTVQSWRRNLGRSEKKANKACQTNLSVFQWDPASERYSVRSQIAELILAGENS